MSRGLPTTRAGVDGFGVRGAGIGAIDIECDDAGASRSLQTELIPSRNCLSSASSSMIVRLLSFWFAIKRDARCPDS